jgi:hypothetical protein
MNGAAGRLLKLRVRNESDMRMIDEAANGFEAVVAALLALKIIGIDMQCDAIRYGVKILRNVRDDLEQSNLEIRGSEQLAGPESWRLQAGYDETFAVEFLDNMDPNMLRMALSRLSQEARAVILAAVCDE